MNDISVNHLPLSPPGFQHGHGEKVATHYNTLQETGLAARSQSRIFYMRNFNNWLKSVLIGEIIKLLLKMFSLFIC